MKKNVFGKVMDFIGLGDDEDDLDFDEIEEIEVEENIEPYVPLSKKGKIVNIQSNNNVKVVLVEPSSFNDAPQICDYIKNRRTVVVNLEKTEPEEARKIFDFLNGSVYALDGKIQKIANGVFILAPNNVDILSEIDEEIRNKSLFSWQNK
ncbi:MAG TPA: cell division protein SepF [Eubacteriaceae bacterium]|jgi:cell division inhibitor SepF|nr:cell division protein SepF [Eubacteriaceae bacterium]